MSEIELKSRPFCGSEDSEMQQCQAEHYVQCLECEGATALFSSRREARELWNRRAPMNAQEGYALVPSILPEKMLDALYCAEGGMCDDDMQKLWEQLLAACPEVK